MGLGIEKNNEEATLWFHRAAEQGSLPAWGALKKIKYFSPK
jgi:TPR repeat protein